MEIRTQCKKPLRAALFLVIALPITSYLFIGARPVLTWGILGGPAETAAVTPAYGFSPLAILSSRSIVVAEASARTADLADANTLTDTPVFPLATLADSGRPVGSASGYSDIVAYKIRSGDNLSKIAANFGISVQTIISANPQVKRAVLQPGQEITILPISGVVYHIREGETLESVASLFNIKASQIQEFNRSVSFGTLAPGTAIVIPGGRALPELTAASNLPNMQGYLLRPAEGLDWGILHNYNAVDIANSCGTPVMAAAEGLVVPDNSLGSGDDNAWNGGYGKFVFIEHPNGVKTRYAHLQDISVVIGDYVKQGQSVGTIGRTGDATGCHLHFEVYGGTNPFAK